jgi:hypothetical protein
MSNKNVFLILAVIFTILCAGCFLGAWWTDMTTVSYNYRNAVHSHMENAYYSSDPTTMKTELYLAIQGMHDLNLNDNMYGVWLPWNKVPNNQMKWQYTHMNSVLTRVDEWQKWEISQSNTGSQQMQDVNTQKLDNVRHFIKDDGGWSDDIAEGAYTINYYFYLIMMEMMGIIFLILAVIFGLGWMFSNEY